MIINNLSRVVKRPVCTISKLCNVHIFGFYVKFDGSGWLTRQLDIRDTLWALFTSGHSFWINTLNVLNTSKNSCLFLQLKINLELSLLLPMLMNQVDWERVTTNNQNTELKKNMRHNKTKVLAKLKIFFTTKDAKAGRIARVLVLFFCMSIDSRTQ